jgi:hypothetical protein
VIFDQNYGAYNLLYCIRSPIPWHFFIFSPLQCLPRKGEKSILGWSEIPGEILSSQLLLQESALSPKKLPVWSFREPPVRVEKAFVDTVTHPPHLIPDLLQETRYGERLNRYRFTSRLNQYRSVRCVCGCQNAI